MLGVNRGSEGDCVSGEIKIISGDEYHEGPGVSKSGLELVRRSPFHYWARYLDPNRVKREPTQSMIIGSAFDLLVTEPESFDKKFFVMPEGMIRKGKAWDELAAANEGKDSLNAREMQMISAMRESLMRQAVGRALFEKGKFQRSFFWTDDVTGELCKCRPDFWTDDNVVVDLKTATSAEFKDFQKSCVDYNYHISTAFTLDGMNKVLDLPPSEAVGPYVFCVIEKEPPYAAAVFETMGSMVELGRQEYQTALMTFSHCRRENHWPGYPDELQSLTMPTWFKPKGTI